LAYDTHWTIIVSQLSTDWNVKNKESNAVPPRDIGDSGMLEETESKDDRRNWKKGHVNMQRCPTQRNPMSNKELHGKGQTGPDKENNYTRKFATSTTQNYILETRTERLTCSLIYNSKSEAYLYRPIPELPNQRRELRLGHPVSLEVKTPKYKVLGIELRHTRAYSSDKTRI
jgi:hypothetical protein